MTINIKKIKNQKLKNFLKSYKYFLYLPKFQKEQYLNYLLKLSNEEQIQIYHSLKELRDKKNLFLLKDLYKKIETANNKLENYLKN